MQVKFYFRSELQTLCRRDSYRQRVYDAERSFLVASHKTGLLSKEAAQELVDRIVASPTWREITTTFQAPGSLDWKERKVLFSEGHGRRGRACSKGGKIEVPSFTCYVGMILHEMAHEAVPRCIGHHWPFCWAYIKLVGSVLGMKEADGLRASFDAAGVPWMKPTKRVLSEETKEKLRANCAKARAARMAKLGKVDGKLASMWEVC